MKIEVELIKKYVRVANYLSAAQIYLQDNFLAERKLKFEDIKPRLLGHWGTCPGINFVYANLNNLIKKHKAEMIFVLGKGMVFLRFKLIFSWKELSQNIIQKLLKMLQDSNTSLRISAGLTDSRVTVIQVLRE